MKNGRSLLYAVGEWFKYENKLGGGMIKQLLNSVISKYRDLSVKRLRGFVFFLRLLNTVNASLPLWHAVIFFVLSCAMILICLIASTFCYAKIYLTLHRMQAQVQDNLHHSQLSGAFQLNIARCKKSVSTACWVHLALVVCYIPYTVMSLRSALSSTGEAHSDIGFFIVRYFAIILIYLNSSINPALYCWRIREVRQIVKNTLKQCDCTPLEGWSQIFLFAENT